MSALSDLSSAVIGAFGAWLATVIGLSGGVAAVLAAVLAIAIILTYWYYQNVDGSMDVYLSNTTIALIPVYALMPDSQPIVVRLGTHDVILML